MQGRVKLSLELAYTGPGKHLDHMDYANIARLEEMLTETY